MRNVDYTVPSDKTTYETICVNVPANLTVDHHAIAFKHVLMDSDKQFIIHHFILRGHRSLNCGGLGDQLWGWVPGVDAQIFPAVAGARIGATQAASMFSLLFTYHYSTLTTYILIPKSYKQIRTLQFHSRHILIIRTEV